MLPSAGGLFAGQKHNAIIGRIVGEPGGLRVGTIDAIENQRPCRPSFLDGVRAQAVMEAALISDREKRWADVPQVF